MRNRFSKPRPPGTAPAYRSTSQLEMLAGCGQQFAFRYLENLKEPGSLAKAKGSAIHGAAQSNFGQKIDSDADISLEDFRGLAAERFEAETKGAMLFTPAEESTGISKAVGLQKDATVKLAEFYHTTISPDYQPAATEQDFSIELPSAGTTIVGVIDLVDVYDRIIDHKTSKRAKSQKDADTSLQLTTYAAARTKIGRPPPEIVLDTAVQTAGGKSYRNELKTARGPDDYSALANRIVAAEKVIKSGAFMPAPAKAWWCSPEWCGFWTQCPYVNRKRVIAIE